jgi:hypothetical protein
MKLLSNLEKARIKLKMEWEGGLKGYMSYGVSKELYDNFKDEFDKVYAFYERDKYTKEQKTSLKTLESKLEEFFKDIDPKIYSDDELNSVNYIL